MSDLEGDLLALAQLIADAYYEIHTGTPPMPGREPSPNESDVQLAYTLTQHGYRRTT